MSQELLMLLGAISQMPQETQDKIKGYAERIRQIIAEGEEAKVAFGLVGLEETEDE